MRHITILRHAKSSWTDTNLKDFDRPLASRGKEDIPLMAKELVKRISPKVIITSPALRAKDTAIGVNKKLKSKVLIHYKLYEASTSDILKAIAQIDKDIKDIVIVGHNPSLHDFIEQLSGKKFDKIPTCSATILATSATSWDRVSDKNTKLKEFLYPKMFRK